MNTLKFHKEKSYTRKGTAPCTRTSWGHLARKQLDRRGPGGPSRHGVEHKPADILEKKKASCIMSCIRRSRGNRFFSSIQSSEVTPRVLHPVLVAPVQESHGNIKESPGKAHKDNKGTGASLA